MNKVVYKV